MKKCWIMRECYLRRNRIERTYFDNLEMAIAVSQAMKKNNKDIDISLVYADPVKEYYSRGVRIWKNN